MKRIFQKVITTFVLGVMVFSLVTPILFWSKPVKSQPVPVIELESQPEIRKSIWQKIKEALSQAAAVAWKNALNMFLGKMAYETATYLGTFGKGGQPLFFTDKKYWTKLGDSVIGEFLDEIAQKGLGQASLCDPIYPEIKLALLLYVSPAERPFEPEVRCSLMDRWNRMKDLTTLKLEWQGVKIEEGKAPVMNLKQRIDVDFNINQETKMALISMLDSVLEIQIKIADLANRIKGVIGTETGFDKKPFEEEKYNLLKQIVRIRSGFGRPNLIEGLDYWIKNLNACLKKNQNDFCKSLDCRNQIICSNLSEQNCLTSEDGYKECFLKLERGLQYAKQIEEMVAILEKSIEDIEEALELGQPPNVDILQDIQKKFTPEGSDLGAALELKAKASAKKVQEVSEGKWLQGLQGEISGITSKISGLVITPGAIVSSWAQQKLVADPSRYLFAYTGIAIADAINVFTTTLLNNLAKTIFEKGIAPPQLTGEKLEIGSGYEGEEAGGIHAKLADLPLITTEADFEILSQYSSCPDKRYALPTQCVIDASFARAVEENLTIKEAIDKNFIKKDWLIGADGERDLMKIKKLRRARIVPLGLEIAVEKIIKGEAPQTTLEKIINDFDRVSSDGDCTIYVKDGARPELMEKNCNEVGGTWNDTNNCCQRNNQCLVSASPFCHLVDPNWVLKAPKAQCELYGPSAIPLTGSSERQETCLNWKDCIGEDEDGNCHSYGYCTREKNIWRFKGTECPSYYNTCQVYTRVKDNQKFAWLKNTLDFDECDANSVGCQWYCQRWDKDLNGWACLTPNRSWKLQNGNRYEYDDPYNTIFFNKFIETCSNTSEGCTEFIRTKENLGTNLLPNSSFEDYQENSFVSVKGWQITNGNFLVDENEAKSGKVSAKFTANGSLTLANDNVDIPFLPNTRYTLSFWVKNKDNNDQPVTFEILNTNISKTWIITKNTSWQRVSWDFVTLNSFNKKITDLKISASNTSNNLYLDDLQLEVGGLSSYKSYGSTNKIYLKKAPEWMKCYNRDNNGRLITSDDDLKCFDYVLACHQDEVGCEKYTPVVGGPYLPAVGKETDRCPRECVGYEAFKQKATNFYPEEETYFIPSTARTCPASEVGCEEFTNLDLVAKGGEGREYYSYLRPCQKPRAECQYFYTWVGSETSGYQLKRYYLLAKDGAPETMLEKMTAENLWGKCENSDDARTNPNCKEFYNLAGQVFYRLYKNTITCSESCVPLRKTTAVSSSYCPTETKGGISLNGVSYQNGICTYMALPSESEKCSSVNVGCREYQGNAINNLRIVFEDDFENLTISPWTGGELSSESIYFGGHSMRVGSDVVPSPFSASRNILIQKGKSYLLSFWIKGTRNNQTISVSSQSLNFGSKSISSEWQSVSLGPVYLNTEPSSNESLKLESETSFFIDNIILKEVKQNIFAIKDSWTTPEICDNPSPQFYLGCQEYKDRNNFSHFFKSFSKLCPEEKIGCEALINTQNSTSPFKEEFNKTSPDDERDNVLVLADQLEYLVNDNTKACPASEKGCQKFGLPKLDQGEPISWTDFYFKNDPDLYIKRPILCQFHQQNCEEFQQAGGGKLYFKDPIDKVCIWREKVPIGGELKTGWFKKGTDQPCYDNYLPDGITYGIKSFSENGYQGFVGECEERFAGCNEYIDPLTTWGTANLVENGDFETELGGKWRNNRHVDPNNPYGTFERYQEGTNFVLKVSAGGTPLGINRVAGVTQEITPSWKFSGASYVLTGKYKIENLEREDNSTKSHLSFVVGFDFEGSREDPGRNFCPENDEECKDWQECYQWSNGNWVVKTPHCWSGQTGKACKYGSSLKECLKALSDQGYQPERFPNFWAWNAVHGYYTGGEIQFNKVDNVDNQWKKASLPIIAGGEYNPRNLPIKKVFVDLLLAPDDWSNGHAAKGTVYFDDVELKPLSFYYYLDNDQLDKKSCNGLVSLKEGCVLFKDQSNPNLIYNSFATYAKSEANQERAVSPVDCSKTPWLENGNCDEDKYKDTDYCKYCYPLGQTSNDTNLILKVKRDRVCGEWLYCAGKRYVWQEQQHKFIEICDHFLRCQKQTGKGEGAECSLITIEPNISPLTEKKYKERDVGWRGMDYSGYSLFNFYPLETLRAKNYPNGYALTYYSVGEKICNKNEDCQIGQVCYNGKCVLDDGVGGKRCNKNEDCPIGQVCYNGKCVIPPTCKLYPETSSPFSRELENIYRGVNFCTERGGKNCVCFYRKAKSTLGEINYFNLETDVESIKVCTQAENPQDLGKCCSPPCPIGMPVAFREDCTRTEEGRKNNLGKCEPMKEITDYIGVAGYCLEPDLEKPKETQTCLTWFPGEAFTGLDPYNQVRSAGYFPASDRRWYGYKKFDQYSKSENPLSYFNVSLPLAFNLTSAFPVQKLGGNWGCGSDYLVSTTLTKENGKNEILPPKSEKQMNNFDQCGNYAYCFITYTYTESNNGTYYPVAAGKYLPYLEKPIRFEEINKIEVKYAFRWEDTHCKDLIEMVKDGTCETGNHKCCGPKILTLNSSGDVFRGAAYLDSANGQCPPDGPKLKEFCPSNNNKSCLFVQANFNNGYLDNFDVQFNDDKILWGGAVIFDVIVNLKSGGKIPLKLHLAPANHSDWNYISCWDDRWEENKNKKVKVCCQDYLGFKVEELNPTSGQYLRNAICASGSNRPETMASCFRGDQKSKDEAIQAVYLFESRYLCGDRDKCEGNFNKIIDRKIYEHMIDKIEIDWKINYESTRRGLGDPNLCNFTGNCQGTIVLPYEDQQTGEKQYQKTVTCKSRVGEARLMIEALFNQKDNSLLGFKTEWNDDGSEDGAARIDALRIYLKEGSENLVKVVDKPYLPTVVNTNLIKLKPDGTGPYDRSPISGINYDYECLPRGATGFQGTAPFKYIVDSKANVCHLYSGGIYESFEDLIQLFPLLYSQYSLDQFTLNYNGPSVLVIDNRARANLHSSGDSPKIQSVCFENGVAKGCEDGSGKKAIGKMTIGNQDSGNIMVTGRTYTANLKFYAWADGRYMPIREVIVDWGDGFQSGSSEMIAKNRKPACEKDDNGAPISFGDDPDACLNQYWEFVHTYICSNPNGCSYQPKVYVKDNWGWCTGNVYAGDKSCYGTSGAGIPYDGQIIIQP